MAWPNAPTFSFRKLPFAQIELIDGSEPTAADLFLCRSVRATLIGLGLNKMQKKSRELEDTPSVRGMINSMPHMVEIIEEKG